MILIISFSRGNHLFLEFPFQEVPADGLTTHTLFQCLLEWPHLVLKVQPELVQMVLLLARLLAEHWYTLQEVVLSLFVTLQLHSEQECQDHCLYWT